MKSSLTAWFVVALLAGAASAGDAEDRLRDAVAKISDGDPVVRAEGRALLGALAEERPDLVKPVTNSPDPEVAATAREVIFECCILKDQVEQGRYGEILAAIADPSRDNAARRALFRRYLDLGPKAAEFLAVELKESLARSTTRAVVLIPGQIREIELTMRNVGPRALWYNPGSYVLGQTRPEGFGGGGHFCGRRNLVVRGGGPPVSAEDLVLDSLSSLRRVPPGADFVLATATVESNCCALFRLRVTGKNTPGCEALFQGVVIPSGPLPIGNLPSTDIPFLVPLESSVFKATILPKGPGGRPALSVTATADIQIGARGNGDTFWWAATDAEGRYLGSGPMREALPFFENWKESEEQTVEMPCDPPAGTRKLWLGFEGDGSGDQAVPPPLEIPGPGTEVR